MKNPVTSMVTGFFVFYALIMKLTLPPLANIHDPLFA